MRTLRRWARAVHDFFRYDLHHGIRNLILFFGAVWKWREWDYVYDYRIFMRAIELHRAALRRRHHHLHWKRDAASMDLVLRRWKLFEDRYGARLWNRLGWDRGEFIAFDERQQKAWDLMHDHLKRSAQGWWD